MKHILVTGGSGFLGRRIVHYAREAGYRVTAPRSAGFNLETGEGIDDTFRALKEQGHPVDCVIHSAAYYGGLGINQTDPAGLISRNNRMSANIFEALPRWGVGKLVSVGSSCAYPGDIHDDLHEEDMFRGRCHDSVEAYGFNKRVHLVYMRAYHKQYGLESCQMALTNMYGEHDVFQEYRSHVVAALIKKIADAHAGNADVQAWGTGTPIREFLYVDDAARLIVRGVELPHQELPVNCFGEESSIHGLAKMISEITGYDFSRVKWDRSRPDGVLRKVMNQDRTRRLFSDYQPTPLREGLEKTIRWYLDNKEEADRRS